MLGERLKNYSEGHCRAKNSWLGEMALFMQGRKNPDPVSVSTRDAFAWWGYLKTDRIAQIGKNRGRNISLLTMCTMISSARRFFGWLVLEEQILLSPFEKVEIARMPKSLPRDILTREEVKRLLDTPDTRSAAGIRDRAILELLYSTGLRRSEATKLIFSDLDLSGGRVFVKEGKGRKDRVVPIGKKAVSSLRKYLAKSRPKFERGASERIWLSESGKPLESTEVGKRFNTHAKKAGLSREITPHTMRHTFATHMIDAGAPVSIVQRILGHSSIRTTQIYTRVTIRTLRRVHRKAHPRAQPRVF